jgi:hypothetical protein
MAGLPRFLTFIPSTTRCRIFETTNDAAAIQNGCVMEVDVSQALKAEYAETT